MFKGLNFNEWYFNTKFVPHNYTVELEIFDESKFQNFMMFW